MKKRFLAIVLLLAITCALCVSAAAIDNTLLLSSGSPSNVILQTAAGKTVSALVFNYDYSPKTIENMN